MSALRAMEWSGVGAWIPDPCETCAAKGEPGCAGCYRYARACPICFGARPGQGAEEEGHKEGCGLYAAILVDEDREIDLSERLARIEGAADRLSMAHEKWRRTSSRKLRTGLHVQYRGVAVDASVRLTPRRAAAQLRRAAFDAAVIAIGTLRAWRGRSRS